MKAIVVIMAVVGLAGWYVGAGHGWLVAEGILAAMVFGWSLATSIYNLPDWVSGIGGLNVLVFLVYSAIGGINGIIHLAR